MPAGNPDGGEWTSGGGGGGGGVASAPRVEKGAGDFLVKLEIKNLPPGHMDGLNSIGFEQGMITSQSAATGALTEALGTYDPQKRTINLSMNARSANNPGHGTYNVEVFGGHTVIHEVGHHVHLARITESAAKEWEAISENGTTARISAYARTNRGEHFAETYRAYYAGGNDRAKLKNLEPSSYKFMASLNRASSGKLLPVGTYAPVADWVNRYK